MSKQWQVYSEKYQQLSVREQYLILFTGLVAAFFITFHLFVDPVNIANEQTVRKIERLKKSNTSVINSIAEVSMALKSDPDQAIENKIAQYETKLANIDGKLLTLTSDLINPVQMRHALIELLKLEKGVSLLSFELLGAEPLLVQQQNPVEPTVENNKEKPEAKSNNNKADNAQVNLYRHGIKLKLSGGYFQLQNYLRQLEQLKWKFFWQEFRFQLKEYPESELEITIYNLSTKKEFVGV